MLLTSSKKHSSLIFCFYAVNNVEMSFQHDKMEQVCCIGEGLGQVPGMATKQYVD